MMRRWKKWNNAPENVLSANRRRRLLFPTPEEETQDKLQSGTASKIMNAFSIRFDLKAEVFMFHKSIVWSSTQEKHRLTPKTRRLVFNLCLPKDLLVQSTQTRWNLLQSTEWRVYSDERFRVHVQVYHFDAACTYRDSIKTTAEQAAAAVITSQKQHIRWDKYIWVGYWNYHA